MKIIYTYTLYIAGLITLALTHHPTAAFGFAIVGLVGLMIVADSE